jgi:LPXTG-motif cell wall-anchored protein
MNMVHLPTVKTHVFTTITGAMKNAFGGLIGRNRHWTHGVIHETLVDLLQVQQDIHPAIFAVMDGTFSGDGPGPRAMRWHETDVLMASADQVAIDAISAKVQGFDPLKLAFIRIAHERGMGVGDPRQIQIVGDPAIAQESWGYVQEDTFASRGQKMIYHGWLHSFEKPLLRSPLVPWSYFASNFYHNVYWYPFIGRKRVESALQTKWGQLFKSYGDGEVVMPGMEPKTVIQAGAGLAAGMALLAGLAYVFLRRKK